MTEETKNKIFSKLFSCKLWITLWCMGLLTYIIIANKTDFMLIAQILCVVPPSYIGVNVLQKKIISDAEKE